MKRVNAPTVEAVIRGLARHKTYKNVRVVEVADNVTKRRINSLSRGGSPIEIVLQSFDANVPGDDPAPEIISAALVRAVNVITSVKPWTAPDGPQRIVAVSRYMVQEPGTVRFLIGLGEDEHPVTMKADVEA